MRIGVLSDTHLRQGQTLPAIVWRNLQGVDLILHAGDVVASGVLEELAAIAPVRAVQGNCDSWELIALPQRDIITCAGLRIGLIHGSGGQRETTVERAWRAFERESVNAIVFGHTHGPFREWRNGVLLFNPGSPTNKRRESRHSLGLLEINHGEIRAEHCYFD